MRIDSSDSPALIAARIQSGRTDFALALVPVSNIFEFPHYAASEADYQAVKALNMPYLGLAMGNLMTISHRGAGLAWRRMWRVPSA